MSGDNDGNANRSHKILLSIFVLKRSVDSSSEVAVRLRVVTSYECSDRTAGDYCVLSVAII